MTTLYPCKETLNCSRCGDCCRFKGKDNSEDSTDLQIRRAMYARTGIIYAYPLSRFTISLTNEEKLTLEKRAKEQGISINIKPKKIIIKDNQIAVLDWFVDEDSCPFLKEKNDCSIYEDRPLICRVFPRTKYTPEEEKQLIMIQGDININFDDALTAIHKSI